MVSPEGLAPPLCLLPGQVPLLLGDGLVKWRFRRDSHPLVFFRDREVPRLLWTRNRKMAGTSGLAPELTGSKDPCATLHYMP